MRGRNAIFGFIWDSSFVIDAERVCGMMDNMEEVISKDFL